MAGEKLPLISRANYFFDGDGISDYVGIVKKCENERVYTAEGNSGDVARQEDYAKVLVKKLFLKTTIR